MVQESILVAQEPIMVAQESILVPQVSILVPKESILVLRESILVAQESILVPHESIIVPLSQKNENSNWHNWGAIWSYRALVEAIGLQIWRSFTWAGSQELVSSREEQQQRFSDNC